MVKQEFKCFIGNKDDYGKVKKLCIMLSKMSRYTNSFDESKYMYFLIKGNEFLIKNNDTLDKVSNSIKKDLIGN